MTFTVGAFQLLGQEHRQTGATGAASATGSAGTGGATGPTGQQVLADFLDGKTPPLPRARAAPCLIPPARLAGSACLPPCGRIARRREAGLSDKFAMDLTKQLGPSDEEEKAMDEHGEDTEDLLLEKVRLRSSHCLDVARRSQLLTHPCCLAVPSWGRCKTRARAHDGDGPTVPHAGGSGLDAGGGALQIGCAASRPRIPARSYLAPLVKPSLQLPKRRGSSPGRWVR